jgi:hypothetical protein
MLNFMPAASLAIACASQRMHDLTYYLSRRPLQKLLLDNVPAAI